MPACASSSLSKSPSPQHLREILAALRARSLNGLREAGEAVPPKLCCQDLARRGRRRHAPTTRATKTDALLEVRFEPARPVLALLHAPVHAPHAAPGRVVIHH